MPEILENHSRCSFSSKLDRNSPWRGKPYLKSIILSESKEKGQVTFRFVFFLFFCACIVANLNCIFISRLNLFRIDLEAIGRLPEGRFTVCRCGEPKVTGYSTVWTMSFESEHLYVCIAGNKKTRQHDKPMCRINLSTESTCKRLIISYCMHGDPASFEPLSCSFFFRFGDVLMSKS